ncbi:MAG TPA: GerMN domain-containing protein [Fimbriimonadaceae bacterium]|nr:hypothetical protein [Armatimonadota bacterium]HCM73247.1 hypothetical protein [Armatimonadota bacterium]HRD30169.1 GerMN domain-containing protein [Fimbriimonadaceae bacterium]HRE94456.1 GerMN domain-containing protein [Fimbriimonadaceae bacterium]HRI74010.1 GerMN domain-containing protein [Fimbriimonadaceae bacterium]
MSETKNSASKKAPILVLGLAAACFGALAWYITSRPVTPITHTDPVVTNNVPTDEEDAPKGGEVTTLTPTYTGGEFGTKPGTKETPKGEDPMVFALNDYLDKVPAVPKEADVLSVSVKEGIATVDFNDKIYAGYGAEDEQIIVRGLLRVMAQFPEVKSVTFTTSGQPLDSLGAIDLSSPQPVEKS